MHAEASTPEWSDVEQGQFPSPATTPRSDSEIEFIGAMEHPAPLWVLDLTLSDYVAWTRQGHVQSYAHSSFEKETDPNSIMWPTWWTIASDSLSDDEDGTIYVADEVCMLRCTVTMVLFEDGIIRPAGVRGMASGKTNWKRENGSFDSRAIQAHYPALACAGGEQGCSTKNRRMAQGKDAYCANPKGYIW